MPLIDAGARIVVTAAPGTGSTSLLAAMGARPGVRAQPERDVEDADGHQVVDAKHATVAQLVEAGLFPRDHGCRVVTTTRNPFDFYVAEWSRSRTRWVRELRDPDSWVRRQPGAIDRLVDALEHPFPEWLELALRPHLRAGTTTHLNPGHVTEADLVLRMEHMAQDASDHGLDIGPLPHLNSSSRDDPYWVHYTRAARAQVEAVHRPDLDRFGYAF